MLRNKTLIDSALKTYSWFNQQFYSLWFCNKFLKLMTFCQFSINYTTVVHF